MSGLSGLPTCFVARKEAVSCLKVWDVFGVGGGLPFFFFPSPSLFKCEVLMSAGGLPRAWSLPTAKSCQTHVIEIPELIPYPETSAAAVALWSRCDGVGLCRGARGCPPLGPHPCFVLSRVMVKLIGLRNGFSSCQASFQPARWRCLWRPKGDGSS